ncbi:MAG: selenide, water dikinase SelD [Marinifilaceae bacterium]|jgi:selenide,water dikinase|nr:selenide, water dikinase SelD [Marinifilaceae bacterium]
MSITEKENLSIGFGAKLQNSAIEDSFYPNYFDSCENLNISESTENTVFYDLGDGRSLVKAVRYYPMILDNLYTYGKVAVSNTLNEIYACGATPISALMIGGWPKDKISLADTSTILRGAAKVCDDANIKITGGYYVNASELFFGLSVTGIIDTDKIKKADYDTMGCNLYLMSELGGETCLLAQKLGLRTEAENHEAVKKLGNPEKIGAHLAEMDFVKTIGSISSYGLLGSIVEICKIKKDAVELDFDAIPFFEGVKELANKEVFPTGAKQNWNYYKNFCQELTDQQAILLASPQNNTVIICAIERGKDEEFIKACQEYGCTPSKIGKVTSIPEDGKRVYLK